MAARGALQGTAIRTFITAAVTAASMLACTPNSIRTAPFRDRPDSIEAGDLRGPFDGRVVEAASDKPVAGALVYATWTLSTGYGMSRPDGFKEYVTNTDADGRYTIPAIKKIKSDGAVRLTDFSLVVYKRGYVAYRNDRRFTDMGPRRDFAQHHNRIKLERWREDFSHSNHLRYIGGGPAISALTAWETEEAAAELTSGRARVGAIGSALLPEQRGAYLVAGQLLTADDVKGATNFDGSFETGPLGDEPDTTTYSSQHLKALNRSETYDVALRVWRLEPDKVDEHYKQLAESLPSADERDEIADRSLRATEGAIFGVAFLDKKRGIVALLTCGQSQCNNADVAVTLARGVFNRITSLWPL